MAYGRLVARSVYDPPCCSSGLVRKSIGFDGEADRPTTSLLQLKRWTAWERRHGCATCRRPSGAFKSGTPPVRCVPAVPPCMRAHCPVHTSDTKAQSSLAARGRSSLAGRWRLTSSSTRRPCRHRRPRPTASRALPPNVRTSSRRSRQSAAGPSPDAPMADHDRPSDRWAAVRGSGRRLPDRKRHSPGVDLQKTTV